MGGLPQQGSPRARRRSRIVAGIGLFGLIAAAVIVGPSTLFAPGCSGTEELRFADGSAVPLCDLRTDTFVSADWPALAVRASLPGRGPYGAGSELAELFVQVEFSAAPGGSRGQGSINVRPEPLSFLGTLWSVLDWSGPCRAESTDGVLAVSCALEPDPEGAGSGRGTLAVRAEIPAPPDPRSDPAFTWLEVTYAVSGGHAASGTALVALEAGAEDPWRMLSVRLADGGLLILVPGAEGAPPARLVPAAPQESPGLPGHETPSSARDIEFPACVPAFGPEPYTGSMVCTGGKRAAPSEPGAAVRVEVSWRPAP